jgi:succinate-semialdehyde dehydrogenase/glutarate-semialdehyde dehydrogenase
MKSINPATGEVLATFEPLDAAAVEERLARAASAFESWRRTPFDERGRLMRAAADVLDSDAGALGRTVALEMGRPLAAAVDEIRKCARGCRFYQEHAARFLADEPIATDAASSYVRYEPLGVILAVMPWNFPFWQVFRFAAPALMAGNVGLLKHASNVPQAALAIEDVFARAGFPGGVFQTLLIPSDRVPALIEDDRVAAVTLTGSEGAGRDVASRAGRAIKKTVLELGGSDPFIVMPSADLDRAVETAVKARMVNNGQSCIAAKRFIVADAIADRFLERFSAAMSALKVGDPLDPETEVGPLATPAIVEDLERRCGTRWPPAAASCRAAAASRGRATTISRRC